MTRGIRLISLWPWLAALALLWLAMPAWSSTVDDDLPQVYTVTNTGVNLQTGAYMYSKTDLSIGPFTFVRSWGMVPTMRRTDTDDYDQQAFGVWNHNFGYGVRIDASTGPTYTYVYVEGRRLQFAYNGTHSQYDPWTNDSIGTLLTVVNQKFVFTDRSGDVYYFTTNAGLQNQTTNPGGGPGSQVLDHVDYADGRQLSFSYDSSARPTMVMSNLGYALLFKYTSNLLSTVCGFNTTTLYVTAATSCTNAPVKAGYTYTTDAFSGLLSTVTDARGGVTNVSYQSNGNIRNLACVSLPNAATCEISNIYGALAGDSTNYEPTQVRRQTKDTGGVWNFEYHPPDPDDPLVGHHIQNSSAKMTDPYGGVTYARYWGGLIVSLLSPAGTTSTYQYSGSEPDMLGYPEGNTDTFGRDSRQNISQRKFTAKPGSGLADIVSTAVYPPDNAVFPITGCVAASPKLCDKPTSITNPNGNQTTFTYDAAHGGVLTESDPPDAAGIHQVKRRAYAQRFAWIKDSSGTYTQAAAPVWLLSTEKTCRTTATSGGACAGGSADEIVTSYDYGPDAGPNNLRLRGMTVTADGATRRTCYGYDVFDNRVSETRPRAAKASCP